ncbi:MAG: hypothetical protein IJM53_04160 [Lachnospiraceae bacterium]|nr:hypothetical protein [Lachnospiraceae bacterium]
MGIISLTCPNCGGKLDVDTSCNEWYCNYCGTRVIKDKKYIEISGSVDVKGIATPDSLIERAYIEMEYGQFAEADSLLERALDADPRNWKAYMGKLMCSRRYNTIDSIRSSTIPLTWDNSFNKAMQCAPEEERSKWLAIEDEVQNAYETKKIAAERELKELQDKVSKKQTELKALRGKSGVAVIYGFSIGALATAMVLSAIFILVLISRVEASLKIVFGIATLVFWELFVALQIWKSRNNKKIVKYHDEKIALDKLKAELEQFKNENHVYLVDYLENEN